MISIDLDLPTNAKSFCTKIVDISTVFICEIYVKLSIIDC